LKALYLFIVEIVELNGFVRVYTKNVSGALRFSFEISAAEEEPLEPRDLGHILIENRETDYTESPVGSYLFPEMINVNGDKGWLSLPAQGLRDGIVLDHCPGSQISHKTYLSSIPFLNNPLYLPTY
jgi:hypothetical protein